ncbi:hypothetical protein [Chengkuizengella axinellae]|uniref:YIP1 family protein n=1 Tax=Chengkuizengella axinellae TaxID=3064388 RepID=A0ABT9J1B6_9BACL|nr:hypothetical protein [Chengkuizengella sp. 2205SS18-9]MDP5275416.1 hypothetical protein [Chengkuizengella sp. 2205SS18-9]
MRKRKAFFLPFIFSLFMIGLLLYLDLQEERLAPSEGWSRSLTLPVQENYINKPFIFEDGDLYHIYSSTNKDVSHLVVDESLEVQSDVKLPVIVPSSSNMWASGNELIFIKNNTIQKYDGDSTTDLELNAEGLVASKDQVVFWQEHQLFELNSTTLEQKQLLETAFPVTDVLIDEKTNSLLVLTREDAIHFGVTFLENKNNNFEVKNGGLIKISDRHKITSTSFALHNREIDILIGTNAIEAGMRSYYAYRTVINLDNITTETNTTHLTIVEKESDRKIRNAQDLVITYKEGVPSIIFSAKGKFGKQRETVNVYEAHNEDGQWLAERRSTSRNLSKKIQWLNSESLIWLGFTGGEYMLYGASMNEKAVDNSLKMTKEDWTFAASTTTIGLVISALIILIMGIWIGPPLVYLILVYIVNKTFIDREVKWLGVSTILVYLVGQITLNHLVLNNYMNPLGLSFTGSGIVATIVLFIFTFILFNLARNKEWGLLVSISYFIGMNMLFSALLYEFIGLSY